MSLARALTKRYKQHDTELPSTPARAASTRKFDGRIDRSKISLPIELISTTNVLAYDAPDLYNHDIQVSSASSVNSYRDSDSSPSLHSSSSISSPETSSIESSPTSPEPNHLSSYFLPSGNTRFSAGSHRQSSSTNADAPAIPSRALSHTKKTHQALARKRSSSQIRSQQPPNSLQTNVIARSSLDMFSCKPEANHPFGAELAQVNELAEEYGQKDVTVWDEEEQYLVSNGFQKFGVEDYVTEIQELFGGVFDDRSFPMAAGWI